MQRLATAVVLLLVFPVASHGGTAEPPVAAVQEFLAAVQRRDCQQAWTYLSAASRAYIECKSREMTTAAPYYAEHFSPHNLYCLPTSAHRYHSYRPDTARLKSLSRGRATVDIERHDSDGFRLPGFFPTKKRIARVEINLTENTGRWLIRVPASATGPRSSCTAP